MLEDKVVYPDLSYKIMGIIFEVFNEMGYGYQEKYYQRALAEAFKENGVQFQEYVRVPLEFRSSHIGAYVLDFLVENKLVIEIKKTNRFSRQYIEQTAAYLKALKLKLGILVNFTPGGIKFRRILNVK